MGPFCWEASFSSACHRDRTKRHFKKCLCAKYNIILHEQIISLNLASFVARFFFPLRITTKYLIIKWYRILNAITLLKRDRQKMNHQIKKYLQIERLLILAALGCVSTLELCNNYDIIQLISLSSEISVLIIQNDINTNPPSPLPPSLTGSTLSNHPSICYKIPIPMYSFLLLRK